MTKSDINWTQLDPALARYGSTEGAWIAGRALLVTASGVVVNGICTCASKEAAEAVAREERGYAGNSAIRRVEFLSWIKCA